MNTTQEQGIILPPSSNKVRWDKLSNFLNRYAIILILGNEKKSFDVMDNLLEQLSLLSSPISPLNRGSPV